MMDVELAAVEAAIILAEHILRVESEITDFASEQLKHASDYCIDQVLGDGAASRLMID